MGSRVENFEAFKPTGVLEYVTQEGGVYVELLTDMNRSYPEIRTLRKVVAVYPDMKQISIADPEHGNLRIPLERIATTYRVVNQK